MRISIPESGWRRAAIAVVSLALVALAPRTARAPLSEEALEQKLTQLVAESYDRDAGGFVNKDRTPNESSIELAWRLTAAGDPAWRSRARRGVEWTWTLFDSVGGGFLRGEKDARHDVASFAKHTDNNAWRLENRVDAWLDSRGPGAEADPAHGAERDRRAAHAVVDFFDRVLLDPRGGFVAGQVGSREIVPESNGAAIRAILCWAAAANEPRWRDFAWKSLDRIWSSARNPEFGFMRLGEMGQIVSVPRLDDQVEMGRAFVLAAHLGGREVDLTRARAIGDLLLERFEDRKQGGMRVQVAMTKDGKVKNAARDPEPNARAARFLAELASVSGDGKYRDAARRLVDTYAPDRNRPAVDDADWVLAIRGLTRAELPARIEWKVPEPTTRPPSFKIRSGKRRG